MNNTEHHGYKDFLVNDLKYSVPSLLALSALNKVEPLKNSYGVRLHNKIVSGNSKIPASAGNTLRKMINSNRSGALGFMRNSAKTGVPIAALYLSLKGMNNLHKENGSKHSVARTITGIGAGAGTAIGAGILAGLLLGKNKKTLTKAISMAAAPLGSVIATKKD